MALVTVCVPAYRSAAFIGATLTSIQQQVLTDYQVLVALEPEGAAETIAVAAGFWADERFSYYVNERTLGYAGNVRGVMSRVRSPYFAVLPHDDLWHPNYLQALLGRLAARPDAAVAFADMYSFGGSTGYRSLPLADGPLADRLLSFFLEGAEGQPWRGLTRSEFADRPYPDSPFEGFAVECEWTLHLLRRGPILHVAEPLYLKRQPELENDHSVTIGWRVRMPEQAMRDALEHHRLRLLEGLAAALLTPAERHLIELAAEAAMFRRWVAFGNGRFELDANQQARVDATSRSCAALDAPAARQVEGGLHLSLSRYHAQRGNFEVAAREARLAVERVADHPEAVEQLARMCLRTGRISEAISTLMRAAQLQPLGIGLSQLAAACATRLAASGLAGDRRD